MKDVTDFFQVMHQTAAGQCHQYYGGNQEPGAFSAIETRVYGHLWPLIDVRIRRALYDSALVGLENFSLERE